MWLAYRLRHLDRPYTITWATLQAQFGSALARSRRFREEFRDDLAAVKEVFPALPATLTEQGLLLRPGAPATLFAATPRRIV